MKRFLTVLGMAAACAALVVPASAQDYSHPGMHRGARLHWSGTVDDTAVVVVRDGSVQTRNVAGNSVRDVQTDVQGRLPERPFRVQLSREQGRGDVRIVEYPSARNNYTTRVRINDPQGGSSHYAFTLILGGGRDF